ncbi:hypothetical protein ATERTT37_001874 [Aspergillus terreus]
MDTTIPSPPKPSNSSIPLHPHNSTGCLSLQYLNQADWQQSNTGTWLDNWWTANAAAISQNGFLNTFAELALNDPGWTCPIDGTCQVPCIPVKQTGVQGNLLARADPLASSTQTGYVANSLSNLQNQFNTLYSILNSAGTKTSLDINSLVQNFWYDGSQDSTMDLSEGLRSFGLILGLGAAIATGGAVMPAAVASALFSNVVTLVFGGLPSPGDPYLIKASEVGHEMSNYMEDCERGLQDLYNNLTSGNPLGDSSDLRDILSDGSFLSSHYFDMSQNMTNAFKSTVINYLWRQSKVFILGGASCSEDQGIGSTGSKEGYEMIWWCDDDNKAWYLYNYQWGVGSGLEAGRSISWVSRPWGADRMGSHPYLSTHGGSGPYWEDLNPWNVVISSVKSWRVAGYNYTTETWRSRINDMYRAGANPWFEGNAMEGLWTIPVCNIAETVNSDWYGKESILMPYGYDSRPKWCGYICDNNKETTQAFFDAAHLMDGDKRPFSETCPNNF